jgi:hypothetical protein
MGTADPLLAGASANRLIGGVAAISLAVARPIRMIQR